MKPKTGGNFKDSVVNTKSSIDKAIAELTQINQVLNKVYPDTNISKEYKEFVRFLLNKLPNEKIELDQQYSDYEQNRLRINNYLKQIFAQIEKMNRSMNIKSNPKQVLDQQQTSSVASPKAQVARPQPETTDSQIFNDYYVNIKNLYLQKFEENMKKLDELKKKGITIKPEDNDPNKILKTIIEEYCRKANAILTNKSKISEKDHPNVKKYWNLLIKHYNSLSNDNAKKQFIDDQCSTINNYLHKSAAEYIKIVNHRIQQQQQQQQTQRNKQPYPRPPKKGPRFGPLIEGGKKLKRK